MAFGNGSEDYPGSAQQGWGGGKIMQFLPEKPTATQSPFSPLCPKCGKKEVEEVDASTVDLTAQKLKCGHCGWETKPTIL
ncbi:MAG TPA: hypothetical protein VKP03_02205 [Patescibacteria group bacterium]|nr:hypothetical protein [Patescibacteria group bacterium]